MPEPSSFNASRNGGPWGLETANRWVDVIARFVKEVGVLPSLVVIGIGFLSGVFPSPLTANQEEIKEEVRKIQIVTSSMFVMRHAECLNKADTDGGDVQWLVDRATRRCNEANERMMQQLATIGLPQIRSAPQ